MGQKATTIKMKATQNINYRFVCEHCKNLSRWQYFIVTNEEEAQAGGWYAHLTPEEETQLKNKVQKGLREKVDSVMTACGKHKYPFNDFCPTCGKHQSWGDNTLYQKLLEVPLCVGVLTAAVLWMTSLLETSFSLWVILGSTGVTLIATLAYVIWRKVQISDITKKFFPEIDWSGK